MAFSPRAFGVLLLFALAVPGQGRQAQTSPAPSTQAPPAAAAPPGVDPSPWLYKGSDIPHDPAWSFGRLPNGLRYAVRRNGVPPGQVAIRVRVDAGSLFERDSERGYAHFIEHLSFRGSEHVPDGEAKRIWQRLGATFGSDTNAQTTPTQTLYKLDLPGATAAGLDESLKILAGMMAHPAITPAAVAAERPVVLAEGREQPGPQVRIGDAIRETFFAGQPLAERAPIGLVDRLNAATADSVRAFHDRWYRPSRTVVIISGDMDPALFAAAVARNFAGWRGVGPDPAEPDFGRPDPSKPTTAAVVEPSLPPVVALATLRPWRYRDDTIDFNQRRMVATIAARVISRRLEARARSGGSFLQAGVDVDDVSRSANVTSVNIVPVGADWQAALKDVRAVIADAGASPPTQGEIDREVADYDTALRTEVETARVEAGAKQADDMAQALDIRETVAAPGASYDILRGAVAKRMFTPDAVLASSRKLFQGDATRALVNTQAPDGNAAAELAAALKADVTGLAAKRRRQDAVTFADLPALGPPGAVASRAKVPGLDLEQVAFANGVRVLLFPNSGETGRVYVRVRFGNGYRALPADRPSPVWAGELALVQGGVGRLDQGDLDQLTAGRRIGLDFGIDDDAFTLSALTSPADLSDQLKLMAAALAHPRFDPAPVARARAVALAAYAGADASPDAVIGRELDGLLRDGDPRWAAPSREQIAGLTPQAFRKLWAPLVASGPIEVSVFGDVKADDAVAAVARSFGALKPRAPAPVTAAAVRFPAHVAAPVTRRHTGPDNQAAAVIAWPTGGGSADIAEARRLDVLAQVFTDRLFERLRQAAGASYSPSVASQWPVGQPGGGRLVAVGQVSPDKVPFFFQIARAIAAELASQPIPADELQRIMRPMAQYIVRVSTGNQFWMQQLAGAAYDPARVEATRHLASDFTAITPQALQATAAKYLRPEADWTMAVTPKGK